MVDDPLSLENLCFKLAGPHLGRTWAAPGPHWDVIFEGVSWDISAGWDVYSLAMLFIWCTFPFQISTLKVSRSTLTASFNIQQSLTVFNIMRLN